MKSNKRGIITLTGPNFQGQQKPGQTFQQNGQFTPVVSQLGLFTGATKSDKGAKQGSVTAAMNEARQDAGRLKILRWNTYKDVQTETDVSLIGRHKQNQSSSITGRALTLKLAPLPMF